MGKVAQDRAIASTVSFDVVKALFRFIADLATGRLVK